MWNPRTGADWRNEKVQHNLKGHLAVFNIMTGLEGSWPSKKEQNESWDPYHGSTFKNGITRCKLDEDILPMYAAETSSEKSVSVIVIVLGYLVSVRP